jgi:nickel-dependent lactate racemase
MEPEPFQKSGAYDTLEGLIERAPESKFLTLVPRRGKLGMVMEDAPFDAIRNAFPRVQMPQARGLVLGAGGRGYDDTFSSALRSVWSALPGVRRAGSVLVIAECSEGVGSSALELLVTERLAEGGRRRERYVEGLEEVFYLNKLKDEYEVLLLSGLPETYARSKLGLTTAKGSGEAVGRMLNRVGRSGKVNVVPRASECLVQSG